MLPPEIEEGNIEYKCYFKDIRKQRFIELSTQMNWRLNEGNGTAYYYIGVNDNGTIYDRLTKDQIKKKHDKELEKMRNAGGVQNQHFKSF